MTLCCETFCLKDLMVRIEAGDGEGTQRNLSSTNLPLTKMLCSMFLAFHHTTTHSYEVNLVLFTWAARLWSGDMFHTTLKAQSLLKAPIYMYISLSFHFQD